MRRETLKWSYCLRVWLPAKHFRGDLQWDASYTAYGEALTACDTGINQSVLYVTEGRGVLRLQARCFKRNAECIGPAAQGTISIIGAYKKHLRF